MSRSFRSRRYLGLGCLFSIWGCSSADPTDVPGGSTAGADAGVSTTTPGSTVTATSNASATMSVTTASTTSSNSTSSTSAGGASSTATVDGATTTNTSTTGSVTGAGGAASVTSTDSVTSTGVGGMGTTGTGTTGTTGTDCEGGKVVHFVYFVEADATYSDTEHANIEAQAYNFQQYWYEQLGVTFYLSDPVVDVIEADHDSAWYLSTPDGIHSDERWYRLGNVKNEVYEKLGIGNFDDNHRVVNYPTTRHDGRVGGNFGGAWMDGDDLSCMAEPNGVNYPYDDGNAAHCLGHVAHEFGHVLGLDHQGPQNDCMQFGFYVSSNGGDMCDFSPDNVAQILSEPDNEGWFEAQPGETCRGL